MSHKTPPIGISGAFILKSPYVTTPTTSYTVIAIREYDEMVLRNQNILRLVYEPVGLGQIDYDTDRASGALVVVLKGSDGTTLYVPNSYIESFPNMGSVPYSRLIVGVSLGMWPENRPTDDIVNVLSEAVQEFIGVTPTVEVTRAPHSGMVTEQQHAQITSARQAAITNRDTPRAVIARLTAEVQRLQQAVDEQAIIIEALSNP